MTKAVFGLSKSDEQARRIIENLISSGFSEDISILYPARNKDKIKADEQGEITYQDLSTHKNVKKGNLTTEKNSKAPEGGLTGAVAGGFLGGSLGLLLVGIGTLAIPGLGPFLAAGPIMAALSGSAVGGSVGLLIGALIGSGIPEYEAKKYEAGLKKGQILISVHTDNDDEIRLATEIMQKQGAQDVSSTTEKTNT